MNPETISSWKFFQLVPATTHINFIGKFKFFVILSLFTVGATLVGIFTKGFKFGIDFTGGTVIQVRFAEPHSAEEARKILTDLGEEGASAVAADKVDREYIITVNSKGAEEKSPLTSRFIEKVGKDKLTILQSDMVGPKVGSELKRAAVLSLIYSVILIMIYIWFRFDFRFAPGATIAMVHDIILASGFYLFFGHEFTITSIAALLTIAGYSVNDTIVIYDRVREILKEKGEAASLDQVINTAINLTLSRTLLTSLITLISVIPIVFSCKGEIQSFALSMCVGLFVGSYSTIYIAAPFTIYAQRFLERKGTKAVVRPAQE